MPGLVYRKHRSVYNKITPAARSVQKQSRVARRRTQQDKSLAVILKQAGFEGYKPPVSVVTTEKVPVAPVAQQPKVTEPQNDEKPDVTLTEKTTKPIKGAKKTRTVVTFLGRILNICLILTKIEIIARNKYSKFSARVLINTKKYLYNLIVILLSS